jgi:PPOX class probable F420-dependent enzyme
MTLDPRVREVLDGTPLAHVATVLPDGAPHVVPVWIGTHEDRVVIFTGPGARKAENLARDPRVAISIAPEDRPYEPVTLRGTVVERIDGDAGWAIIDAVATKYTGGPYPREQERFVLLIEPEHQHVGVG